MSTKEEREHVELLQATLDLPVLRMLLLAPPRHRHTIAEAIEFNSEEILQVEQAYSYLAIASTLRPAL